MTETSKPANTTETAATTIIELLGKPYPIKCQENEISTLQKAAHYLNNSIKALPNNGKLLAPEKLAIMAALNLASQILELEDQMSQHMHFLNQRLGNLQTKLEYALEPTPTLELESA